PDVHVVRPAVVEQVPHDLRAHCPRSAELMVEAVEAPLPRSWLDEMPAHTVADRDHPERSEVGVVLQRPRIVLRGGDDVDPATVEPAVRGALETTPDLARPGCRCPRLHEVS